MNILKAMEEWFEETLNQRQVEARLENIRVSVINEVRK